jgi:molybdopterin-guanine dinucleotide biosynthesis protein A
MTSIVLAGGKSSRLGRNKALQIIDGRSLIQRVIDSLATLSTEIIVVTAHGEAIPCYSAVQIETVADIYPEKGPLGGIYSGLMSSRSSRAVAVGCDTPFLSASLLRYMTQVRSMYDVVVPRIKNKLEPLCAVYSESCTGPIQRLLAQDELRIDRLFGMVKVKYVGESEVNRFDPKHLSFFNVNSHADLDRARRLAIQKR